MANSTQSLGTPERIGYALGDAACNLVLQFVFLFMPFFYTDVFGLTPAAMGTLLLVVRTLSALADPVMGVVCDRTHTRWGKFRPYICGMSVPFGIAAILTFTTPNLSPNAKLAYAYATYLTLMIFYAAVNVPYCSFGAAITRDAQERVSLNSLRYFFVTGIGAMTIYAALPTVRWLGGGDDRLGFQWTMTAIAALAVVMLLACAFLTKERATDPPLVGANVKSDVHALLRNDQWRIVAAINFVLFVALAIQDGLAIGYLTWYAGRKDLVPAFLAVGLVSAMIGAIFARPLVRRFDKGAAYGGLQLAIVVALAALYSLDRSHIRAMFVCYATIEFLTKASSVILWSMMADAVDYGELLTGRRIVGLTLSGSLLTLKLGSAVGGAASLGWLLAYVGYESQSTSQSSRTIAGIAILFTLAPALGHATLIAIVSRYRLTNAVCDSMRTELEQLDSARGDAGGVASAITEP